MEIMFGTLLMPKDRFSIICDVLSQVLGRLATQVSQVLMGKHKPTYNPSDPECGDYVVVINASQIAYSKKTYEKKVYYWHTGWPGGLKKRTLKVQMILIM